MSGQIQKWSAVKFLAISDTNGDGILQINEFFMRGDIVVLATPEIAGLPYVIQASLQQVEWQPQCLPLTACCWRSPMHFPMIFITRLSIQPHKLQKG